jgi:hypothetical protein
MPLTKRRIITLLLTLFLGLVIAAPGIRVSADDKDKKDKKEKKDKGDNNASRNWMWEEPADIESRDLFNGPGGAEGAPDPAETFTFDRRISSGTSEKMEVSDSKKRNWTVKLGAEARPETTATRIVWAAGYHVDQDYFLRQAKIAGRGGFTVGDVRFERRDDGFKKVDGEDSWSWRGENPFIGTREFQGLQTLMALLNNWDMKDVNNKIVRGKKKSGNADTHVYYVADLGATFGSTGSAFRKIPGFQNAPAGTKGDADAYAAQPFIDSTSGGKVQFHYKGKNPKALDGVSVENARWMGNLLSRLSDKQLSDSFRAGGFTDAETQVFVRALRNRINQLKNLR